jgi:nitrite reductase/ring-hydroxylating ferredoxin subunit
MGGGETKLSGPDLAAGIAESDLGQGSLLGHAAGEAVLLVRHGDDVHAVGATCTHYGGPLAEGLVEGGTVRCPWHHACFDLATGAPLRGPALNGLTCYTIKRAGGRIQVGAPRPARLIV